MRKVNETTAVSHSFSLYPNPQLHNTLVTFPVYIDAVGTHDRLSPGVYIFNTRLVQHDQHNSP